MAVRSYRGCGRKVDTSAKSCPSCGRLHPANSGLGILKISAGVVTVLIMVLTVRPSIGAADDSTRGNSPALADLQTITAGLVHSPFEGGKSCLRTPTSLRRHALACAWTARQGGLDRVIRVAKGLSRPRGADYPIASPPRSP
jgi:hypothetical protein